MRSLPPLLLLLFVPSKRRGRQVDCFLGEEAGAWESGKRKQEKKKE